MIITATEADLATLAARLVEVFELEEFQRRFAGRVREIRIKKKLSQETVSGVHMSTRTVQRIEAGEEAPRLETIFRLAEGLGVRPAELFKFQ